MPQVVARPIVQPHRPRALPDIIFCLVVAGAVGFCVGYIVGREHLRSDLRSELLGAMSGVADVQDAWEELGDAERERIEREDLARRREFERKHPSLGLTLERARSKFGEIELLANWLDGAHDHHLFKVDNVPELLFLFTEADGRLVSFANAILMRDSDPEVDGAAKIAGGSAAIAKLTKWPATEVQSFVYSSPTCLPECRLQSKAHPSSLFLRAERSADCTLLVFGVEVGEYGRVTVRSYPFTARCASYFAGVK